MTYYCPDWPGLDPDYAPVWATNKDTDDIICIEDYQTRLFVLEEYCDELGTTPNAYMLEHGLTLEEATIDAYNWYKRERE